MNSVSITLPIPPTCLNPNTTGHWSKKSAARAAQRAAAFNYTTCQFRGPGPKWARARVTLRWFAKDEPRIPDFDNAVASIKGALDGMTDAGVLVNDRGIEGIEVWRVVDKANPRVEVIVHRVESNP